MNYTDFQALPEIDQYKVTLDHYPIANRKDGSRTILLNKVNDFFVEIHFNSTNPNESSLRVIESFSALELYWESVNIGELTRILVKP